MTERLDRIEAQQERNTANIADLITLSSNVLRAVDGLTARIDESNQRFDNLRQEAIADRAEFRRQAETDRQRSDQRFEAMQENIQRLFLELHSTNGRVDNLEQAS
jgi:predicted RNase H-like nuclease (RuvC/YqgF family)